MMAGMGTAAAATKKKLATSNPTKRHVKSDAARLPDSPATYPELLTVRQAAQYMQRHPMTVYREIQDGVIPSYCFIRFGPKSIRIFKSQLDKYMAQLSEGAR